MILRRCAWHPQYHGRSKIFGVASWAGWGLLYSDGMCFDCATRARAEWSLPPATPRVSAVQRIQQSLRPDFALAAWLLVAAIAMTTGLVVSHPPSRAGSRSPALVASVVGPSAPAVARTASPAAAPAPRVTLWTATHATRASRVVESRAAARTIASGDVGGADPRLDVRPAVHVVHGAASRTLVIEARTMATETPIDVVVVPSTPVAEELRPAPAPSRWLASREGNLQAP